jgi:hypothetical protein
MLDKTKSRFIHNENIEQILKETREKMLRNFNEKTHDYYVNEKNRILFLSLFDSSL